MLMKQDGVPSYWCRFFRHQVVRLLPADSGERWLFIQRIRGKFGYTRFRIVQYLEGV